MKLKKEIFFICFIILFIISLELITNYISKKSVDTIYPKIVSINLSLEKNNVMKENNTLDKRDKEKLQDEIIKLKRCWINMQDKLSYFFEHNELEKVTKSIVVLEENAKNEEYTNALEDGKEFIYWLEHFNEKDSLKLKNIF